MINSDHDRLLATDTLSAVGFAMRHTEQPQAEPPGAHGASWELVSEQVRRVLCQLWPQVQEVATDLVTNGSLPAERVRAIVRGAALPLDLDEIGRATVSDLGSAGSGMP